MKSLKFISALFAVVALAFSTTAMRADNIGVSVNGQLGLFADVAGVETYTTTALFTQVSVIPIGVSVSDQTFTATWVNESPLLSVLTITDVCANVTVIGSAAPCGPVAFSFTDASLPIVSLVSDIGLGAGVNVSGAVANIDFGASIGGGTAQFDFSCPPSDPGSGGGSPSPVPEPGTLALMSTGLLGAAGMVRRRFAKIAA